MRKRILATGLAIIMAFGITACNKAGDTTEEKTTTSSETTMTTEETDEPTTEEGTTALDSTTEKKEDTKEPVSTTEENATATTEKAPIKVEGTASNSGSTSKPSSSTAKKPSKDTNSNSKKDKNTNKDKNKNTNKDKNTGKDKNTNKDTNKDKNTGSTSTEKPNKKPDSTENTSAENTTTEKKEVTLQQIVDAVKKAYGDAYLPNMIIETDILAEQYGLTEDLYDEVFAEGPSLSFQIDTFIAVKAKKGKVKAIKNAFEKYKKYLIEDSMQYPMNAAKIPATQVYSFGDYVFFSMLVTPQGEEPETEEAYLAAAKKMNQKAYNTIKKMLQ